MNLEQAHEWADYAESLWLKLIEKLKEQNTIIIVVLTPHKIVTVFADVMAIVESVLADRPIERVTKQWKEAIIQVVMYLSNARPISQIDYDHIKRGNL